MIECSIDGVNLYQRHHIVLENFDIGLPNPQLTMVEVPGRNGKLDMSEALAGHLTYSNRVITLQFGIVGTDSYMEQKRFVLGYFLNKPQSLLSFSHLSGHFKGRCTMTNVTREHGHITLKVECDCFPYRLLDKEFLQERTLTNTPITISCLCMMMPVVPKIETTGSATIRYKDSTFTVQRGIHQLPILFKTGSNELIVSGNGMVKVSYKQG